MGETIINGIIEASQEVVGQLQYARGAKGDTGDSGVYIGTTPPTDPNIKVWIDTSEESGDVEMTSNKVTSISSESTDIQYPSAKAVAEAVDPRTVYQKFIDNNNLKQRNWVDLSFVGGEYYYTDFLQAVADVNADTTVNSTTDSTNAVCQIFKNEDITVLRLLSDLSVTTNVVFEKSVIFDINGYTITLNKDAKFITNDGTHPENEAIFYGAKQGSVVTGTDCLTLFQVKSHFYILGGIYNRISTDDGTGFYVIYSKTSNVEIDIAVYNAYLYTKSKGSYPAVALYVSTTTPSNISVNVYNSKLIAIGENTTIYGITLSSIKRTLIQNCSIFAESFDKGDGSAIGIKVMKSTNVEIETTQIIKNSKIYGITSGIQNNGTLYLQNCKCYSPYHGGVYNGTNGFLYAENCEFHRSICPDGYTPTGWAASYFGYSSTAYLNDCSFILDTEGDTSDGIAIKQGDTTEPTYVYMSNSELPKLRCDSGQYVYLGEGISDTIKNATVNGTKILTDENYSTYINKEMSQPVVDIEYEPTSRSPQSGIAVAEAVVKAKDYTDTKIGDIDTALDNIIVLQNSYIGGNS